jgi:hypothetical protein
MATTPLKTATPMDEKRDIPPAADDPVSLGLRADPMERQGAEWGLASLLTGSMLTVGSVAFLVLAVVTLQVRENFNRFDVGVICTLHVLFTLVVLPINLFSVFAGLRGLFSARRRGQPIAFGLMGFFTSVLALGLWICACAAGFAVLF